MPTFVISIVYTAVAGAGAWMLLLTFFRGILPEGEETKYATAWVLVTAIFFVSPSAPLFALFVILALSAVRAQFHPVVLGIFLLPLIPSGSFPFGQMIPGINFLVPISFPFLIGTMLLVPVALKEGGRKQDRGVPFVDFAITVFWFASIVFAFRETTFTNALRVAVVETIMILGFYLAFSRGLKTREDVRRACAAFVAAMVISAAIGLIAQVINWNWFVTQDGRLFEVSFSTWKSRGILLRIGSTFGAAYIDYGTAVAVAAVLGLPFFAKTRGGPGKALFVAYMLLGILVSATRAPFIALLFGLIVASMIKPKPVSSLLSFGVLIGLGLIAALIVPQGRVLLDYLPFVGSSDSGSVTYREELFRNGWEVIKRSPLFGNPGFLNEPEMLELVQGEGIIDIVNDYLRRALALGLPVAFLYFLAHAWPIYRTGSLSAKMTSADDSEWRLFGAALAGSLALYTLAYATSSKLSIASEIGWFLIGANVAYVRVTLREQAGKKASADALRGEAVAGTGLGTSPAGLARP